MKLNRPDNWLHHLSGAALVLVLSLGTTWWLWQFETRNAELDQRARMDASVQAFASRVEQRVRAQEQVLRGVRGLFSAGAAVGREAFARYVDALQLAADMAGLIGLGWAPLLNAAQMPELEDKMRSQGYSNYVSTPLGARSQYAPLVQRERSVEPSVRMLGQDMMAMPTTVLRWSVPAIRGGSAITVKLTRALESGADGQVAFVVFIPASPACIPVRVGCGFLTALNSATNHCCSTLPPAA